MPALLSVFLVEFANTDLDLFTRYVSNETGKALVQPNVVPPFHRDHVSKPLVSKFVLDDHIESNALICEHSFG